MRINALLLVSVLAGPYPAAAQVPPATPGCAERGGCRDVGPSERSRERESREDDTPSWFRQSRHLYNESIDQIQADDFDGAYASVREALRLDPGFGKARYQYAWLLMHGGRCDAAIGQANAVSGPDAAKAAQLVGYCREKLEDERLARIQPEGPEIGGVAELSGEVFWVAADGSRIPVRPDTRVHLRQRLVTGPGARLKLLLKDDTTFTLHGDSDMVLSAFEYDPNTNVGVISARLLKGVFRFVSGKMRKEPNVWNERIEVPVGAFGIRGTDIEVHTVPDEFRPVQGCDAQGNCKDYKIVAAAILYSGEVNFNSNQDDQIHSIAPNGRYHLITSEGPVIALQP